MITFREKFYTLPTRKLLFINGFRSRGKVDVYNSIQKFLPEFLIDYANVFGENIQEDEISLAQTDFRLYLAVIGFSLGGLYAQYCPFLQTPLILINPSYGISLKFPEYSYVESKILSIPHLNIYAIFGTLDPYLSFTEGYFRKINKKANILYFPGGHTPTEVEIQNYIVPVIKKLFE